MILNIYTTEISSQRHFTASKVLFFCMQLIDSVARVASCYDTRSKVGISDNDQPNNTGNTDNGDDADMISSLKKILSLFTTYKSNIEKTHTSPFWQAMVLDTAAFVGYDASNNLKKYNQPIETNLSNSLPRISTRYAIDCQAVEINRMLSGNDDDEQTHCILSTPTSPIILAEFDTTTACIHSDPNPENRIVKRKKR